METYFDEEMEKAKKADFYPAFSLLPVFKVRKQTVRAIYSKDDKVVVRDIFTWDELTVDKADLQPCEFDIPE